MEHSAEPDDAQAAKKTSDIRAARLRALPHWDEIEIRLRHRWGPDRVLDWHKRAYPMAALPSKRTLFRFLADQPDTWFVERLLIEQTVMERLPHVLVLETQAEAIQLQLQRVRQGRQVEGGDGKDHAGLGGLLYPQLGVEVERLERMLTAHFKTKQEIGLEPRSAAPAAGAGHDPADPRASELAPLVERFVELPQDEFLSALVAVIGPPPVKQPLVLGEATVIEKRPLPREESE